MKIKVRNNNVESALRVFKKKCNEGIFEYREREYYEKPSAKRHKANTLVDFREKGLTANDIHKMVGLRPN